jgi:hypothetical protein
VVLVDKEEKFLPLLTIPTGWSPIQTRSVVLVDKEEKIVLLKALLRSRSAEEDVREKKK